MRFLYWIRKIFTGDRQCKGCCMTCEYYETCKEDVGQVEVSR